MQHEGAGSSRVPDSSGPLSPGIASQQVTLAEHTIAWLTMEAWLVTTKHGALTGRGSTCWS